MYLCTGHLTDRQRRKIWQQQQKKKTYKKRRKINSDAWFGSAPLDCTATLGMHMHDMGSINGLHMHATC